MKIGDKNSKVKYLQEKFYLKRKVNIQNVVEKDKRTLLKTVLKIKVKLHIYKRKHKKKVTISKIKNEKK